MKIFLLAPMTLLAAEPDAARLEFFEKKIRPILVNNCHACHAADTKPAAGLRVDDCNGLLRGGDSGPAIVPGDPAKSLLLERVRHPNPRRRMSKEGAVLTAAQVDDLTTWIRDGAVFPQEKVAVSASASAATYDRLRARLWSLQPVARVNIPVVKNNSWPNGDLDRLILAKLEDRKLAPVADASRLTLIRRATYDLTGLPPTPAQVDAFLAEKSPQAFKALVDRLLASPQFG